MRSALARSIVGRWADARAALTHQLVFTVLFLVAVALVVLAAAPVRAPVYLVSAVVLELGAVVAAAFVSTGRAPWRRPAGTAEALSLVSVLAIFLVERSTSFTVDYLSVLVFVPVASLAWTSGRRGVWLGVIASSALVTAPLYWLHGAVDLAAELVMPSVLIPLVSLALACFIAGAASRQRRYVQTLEDLTGQLRASRDAMTGFVDAVTEQGIVAADAQGRIELFNPGAERLTGLTSEVATGQDLLMLGLADGMDGASLRGASTPATAQVRDERWQALLGSAASGGVSVHDWPIPRVDAPPGTVRVTVTRRVAQPGEDHPGYLFVASDITEQVEADRAKEQFLGYVSHELRTPISSVLGYLELIGFDDSNLTQEQREHLEVVRRNARRLLHLVDDLLLTAQAQSGTFAVAPEQTELSALAAASLRAATPQATEAEVELVDATTGEHPLRGDPTRLGQLVDNLVSNAMKFTPRHGTVTVTTATGASATGSPVAVLTVQDTGMGIPADEVGRITERFHRAPAAAQRRIPGVGLGLAISQAIVDAHGGTLSVSSVVGEGTSLVVTLPVAGPEHPAADRPAPPEPDPTGSSRR